MSYVSEFLNLKCSVDILQIIKPLKKIDKEISEAYSIIRQIRQIKNRENYQIIDFCSGNALVPIISSFLFPEIEKNIAIDKNKLNREYDKINRFKYVKANIYDEGLNIFLKENINQKCILTSIHACKKLSFKICDIFISNEKFEYLFLMPCCIDKNKIIEILGIELFNIFLELNMDMYDIWSYSIIKYCQKSYIMGEYDKISIIKENKNCLSQVNNLIIIKK